ncbi:MAG: AmpG family muropeptide MFS transporter [Gemmatimonadaceae bacterium]
MTQGDGVAAPTPGALSPLRLFGQPKMAALLVLGFSSGLPLWLTDRTLKAWMTTANVDLTTIGLFSLVALPYSIKFLWAPLIDRYVPPFLGRRRGWLLITQILLLVAIAAMATHDPARGLQALAVNAILIAVFSASQDVAGDAYRTDVLDEREMGAGTALWVLGYRIALLVTGSLAFVLADRMPWQTVYLLLSALMLVGMLGAFLAPEPVLRDAPPQTLGEAVILPFQEFFTRSGLLRGVLILGFIVLYRYSDGIANNMTTPFLLQAGYTQAQIGVVLGGAGLIATIVGVIAGGAALGRLGINRMLWIVAILQAVSNLGYYFLSVTEQNQSYMLAAIVIENFVQGLVTAALLSFLMAMCNKRFSATQFALLSSLMAASRDILVAPAGAIAEAAGWPSFFLITVAAGIPALLLLPFIAPWTRENPIGAAAHTGETTDGPG